MKKIMKYKLIVLAVLPLLISGCLNDLFDEGATQQAYDGPDVVAFFPLESEVDEGDSMTMEVQFISRDGLAQSDVSVTISVDGESSAQAGQYSLSTTSLTIPSGSASATFTVDFPSDSGLDAGDEVVLLLNLSTGAAEVETAVNLDQSTIFIEGVDDTP